MTRRRFVTAQELADELGVDIREVLSRVESGGLRMLAPTRAETTAARERGGGMDLLGRYRPSDIHDWLRAYFRNSRMVNDAQYAREHDLPYVNNERVYVSSRAIAIRVRGHFYPNPTHDRVVNGLREINAQHAGVLGADRSTPAGRLIWWRLSPATLQEVMSQ